MNVSLKVHCQRRSREQTALLGEIRAATPTPRSPFNPSFRATQGKDDNVMSFFTSLSGLKGAQTDLAAVSNNLANVGSTGFKKSRAQFGDLFASSLRRRRRG